MKKCVIVGAGNVGSRHLQALKAVSTPLKIYVIDPNESSLNIAKNRYFSIPPNDPKHEIEFFQKITEINDDIDIAIIASCSDIRRQIIEKLLELNSVNYLILEKILFQKEEDYHKIRELLKEKGCIAWVHCPRRIIPMYKDQIKNWFNRKKFSLYVSGSNWGLISNIIHYLDYMVYLLDDKDFKIDLSYLNPKPKESIREGYIEFTGIIQIHFNNGAHGFFQSFSKGQLPLIEELTSDTMRAHVSPDNLIVRAWNHNHDLTWEQFELKKLYASESTTIVIEEILNSNDSSLITYEDSMRLHLKLYNKILTLLNNKSKIKYDYFPFT